MVCTTTGRGSGEIHSIIIIRVCVVICDDGQILGSVIRKWLCQSYGSPVVIYKGYRTIKHLVITLYLNPVCAITEAALLCVYQIEGYITFHCITLTIETDAGDDSRLSSHFACGIDLLR